MALSMASFVRSVRVIFLMLLLSHLTCLPQIALSAAKESKEAILFCNNISNSNHNNRRDDVWNQINPYISSSSSQSLSPCSRSYVRCDGRGCPISIILDDRRRNMINHSFVFSAQLMDRLEVQQGGLVSFSAQFGTWQIEAGEWISRLVVDSFVIAATYRGTITGTIPSASIPFRGTRFVINKAVEIVGDLDASSWSTLLRIFSAMNVGPTLSINVTTLRPAVDLTIESVPAAHGRLTSDLMTGPGLTHVSILNAPLVSAELTPAMFVIAQPKLLIDRVRLKGLTTGAGAIPREMLLRVRDIDIEDIGYTSLTLFNETLGETEKDCASTPYVTSSFRCAGCRLRNSVRLQCVQSLRSIDLSGNVFGEDSVAVRGVAFCAEYATTILPCMFPFEYHGVHYSACTGSDLYGMKWCMRRADGDWGICLSCDRHIIISPSLNTKDISLRNSVNLVSIYFPPYDVDNTSTVSTLGQFDITNSSVEAGMILFDYDSFHPVFDANEFRLAHTKITRDVLQMCMSPTYNLRLHSIDARHTPSHSMRDVPAQHGYEGMTAPCLFECLDTDPACLPPTLRFTPTAVWPGADQNMWCRGLEYRISGRQVAFSRDVDYFDFEECHCVDGSYGNGTACVVCPEHAFCPGGPVKVAWVHAGEGYYAESFDHMGVPTKLTQCRNDDHGETLCPRPSLRDVPWSERCASHNRRALWRNVCRVGHTGRQCLQCEDGYGHVGDICVKCASRISVPLSVVNFVIGLFIILVYAHGSENVAVASYANVMVLMAQFVSVVRLGLDLSAPHFMYMYSILSSLASAEPVASECLLQEVFSSGTYNDLFWLRVVCIAAVLVIAALCSMMYKQSVAYTSVVMATIVNVVSPFLIAASLQVIICDTSHDVDGKAATSHLRASPAVRCDDDAHTAAQMLGITVLTATLALNVSVVVYLSVAGGATPPHRLVGFLLRPFTQSKWWWSVVVHVRNAALALAVGGAVPRSSAAPTVIVTSACYVAATSYHRPYKEPDANVAAVMVEMVLVASVGVMQMSARAPLLGVEVAVIIAHFFVVVMVLVVFVIAGRKGSATTTTTTTMASTDAATMMPSEQQPNRSEANEFVLVAPN
eukprot:PhM_4_TR5196/c0_g1_i2/m.46784